MAMPMANNHMKSETAILISDKIDSIKEILTPRLLFHKYKIAFHQE